MSQHPVDAHGHPIHMFMCPPGVDACPAKPVAAQYMQAVYHPASHFWPLQAVETGLFAGAAIALIAFAAWWAHRSA